MNKNVIIRAMTIDELLIQEEFWYPSRVEEIKRNDESGMVLIIFKNSQIEYSGELFDVPQVLVAFDTSSKVVTAMMLYGFDLQPVCDFVDEYHHFLHFRCYNYLKRFEAFPSTLTLF